MIIARRLAILFGIGLFFLSLGPMQNQSQQSYAASCPAQTDTGVYYDPVQKGCDSAHGAVGFNVNGLQYTCGADNSIACPGVSSGTQGNTCVYYDPTNKTCNSGTGGQGFNPASGCKWRNGYSTQVPCPGKPGSPVVTKPLYVHVNGANTQNPVHIKVNDNGYGNVDHVTDASGNFTLTSFSGDTIALTPADTTQASPSSINTFINTNWGCGRSTSSPCTFTATGGSGGGGGGPSASLTLVLGLPGIGYNGPLGVQPNHLTRTVTVALYDASVTNPSGPGTTPLVTPQTATVTYDGGSDSNAGYFVSTTPITITLPTTAPAGNQYEILVEMPQYLYQLAINPTNTSSGQVNHAFTITGGSSITIPPLILFPGDVATTNGEKNILNINDWTQMLSCFTTPSSCPQTTDHVIYADLDDNGVIDPVDINIWLRSLFGLEQAQVLGCSTGDCQGD